MTFNPFQFIFNKPATIPALPPTTASTEGSTAAAPGTSTAARLSSKISDLISMSQYLQQAIVSRCQTMGVTIDPNLDPDTARSLTAIYGGSTPPTVSVPMYNTMLDAFTGTVQLEMASVGTAIQPNPFQVADLTQVTRAVEKALVQDGAYQTALPLWLRSLKSDTLMLQQWQSGLAQYPVMSVTGPASAVYQPDLIPARTVDVSPAISDYMDDYTDRMASTYTAAYQQLAQPNPAEQDIANVVQGNACMSITALLQVVSQLQLLKATIHKPQLNDMVDDLGNFSFARLAGEVSLSLFNLDILGQMSTSPLQANLACMASAVANVQASASISGRVSVGPLKGMISFSVAGSATTSGTPPGLESQSLGIRTMAEHLDWAQQTSQRQTFVTQKQFQRAAERRLSLSIDRLDVMNSSSIIDTLVGVATALISSQKSGTVASGQTGQAQGEVLNTILSNLQTGTSTTFVVQADNSVLVNPPSMPAPTPPVLNVLQIGGVVPANGN